MLFFSPAVFSHIMASSAIFSFAGFQFVLFQFCCFQCFLFQSSVFSLPFSVRLFSVIFFFSDGRFSVPILAGSSIRVLPPLVEVDIGGLAQPWILRDRLVGIPDPVSFFGLLVTGHNT